MAVLTQESNQQDSTKSNHNANRYKNIYLVRVANSCQMLHKIVVVVVLVDRVRRVLLKIIKTLPHAENQSIWGKFK